MNGLRGLSVVLAILLALSLAACGGDDDSVSQEELEAATEEAAQEARDEAKEDADIAELEDEIKALRRGEGPARSGRAPLPLRPMTRARLAVCRSTPRTAGLASTRARARRRAPSLSTSRRTSSRLASNSFDSYSPATGQTYHMTCTSGAVVTCTGGNNAAVYILSS